MSTFIEAQHRRGQPENAGQFREKTATPPATALTEDGAGQPEHTDAPVVSAQFQLAEAQYRRASEQLQREAVREMRRIAPDGATELVVELYSEGDPELELFAFQCVQDADGEPMEISTSMHASYFDLASRLDHTTAESYGFTRDNEMYSLDLTQPVSTGQDLEDAVSLFLAAGNPGDREAADAVIHTAVIAHIRSLASDIPDTELSSLRFDWGEGGGLHLTGATDMDGQPAWDPWEPAEHDEWDDISFAADNIRNPAQAGLIDHSGNGHGPFTLDLT